MRFFIVLKITFLDYRSLKVLYRSISSKNEYVIVKSFIDKIINLKTNELKIIYAVDGES